MNEKIIGEDVIRKILKYDNDTMLVKIHESKTIEFKDGKVTTYLGNYDDYKAKLMAEI